jgi:protein-disulfide isomerase
VWRHLPLSDVHPHAQLAAEASEAAAAQGAFWEMHDLLLAHQEALSPLDLVGYAGQLGLDLDSVAGTPTFFVNGRRHYGAYDIRSPRRGGGRCARPRHARRPASRVRQVA